MEGVMGRIAEIKPHPKRRKHFDVVIEGHEPLTVHEDVIVALQLYRGMAVTDDLPAHIAREQEAADAMEAALRLLKFRPRARHELNLALRRKGFAEGVVERVLGKLEHLKLVDDERFARDFAESLARRRPLGRTALVVKLRQRGIGAEVAAGAVSDVLQGSDDTPRAVQALAKRLPRWDDLPPDERRAKAYAFLARLGFDHETISDALDTAMTGQ